MIALHKHIQARAEEAGYPRLKTVTKPWLQKYLKKMEMKPFKIKYYLEHKDPDFENKMHDVLLVYKQVGMHLMNPDHNPTEENGYIRRDYEYVRIGTLSLHAGIDPLTGEAIPLVCQTHKSSDFIQFLKIFDAKYPESDTIRLILDNHSAHTSKEARQFLATLPEDRLVFVFTPAHTSWLNMIESFFSKVTKQMLKGIRVNSKEDLSERIYRYFDEINADPIVYHWTYKMDEIDPDAAATI